MPTEVSICNQALGWLSFDSITSLDDESKEAKLCKANFVNLRDAVLEDKDWTFATKRYTLPVDSVAPDWGYSKRYLIPSEVLLVTKATNDASSLYANQSDPNFDYRVEDGYVHCDSDTLYIKAIARVTDPAKFSAGFVQALAARIAADLAIPLTESRTLMEQYWSLYESKVNRAATNDGLQGKSDRLTSTKLTRRR